MTSLASSLRRSATGTASRDRSRNHGPLRQASRIHSKRPDALGAFSFLPTAMETTPIPFSPPSAPTLAVRPIMTREEAADYLRVSVRFLTNLVTARKVRPMRSGRRVTFMKSELDRYAEVLTACA